MPVGRVGVAHIPGTVACSPFAGQRNTSTLDQEAPRNYIGPTRLGER